MVRLAHAAHRLKAWAVLIASATEALKIIPAVDCLVLHHELDLQSVLEQHMQEIQRRHQISNDRARARGHPERSFTRPAWSGGNWNFETVFLNVVKSTDLKLPVAGLDDLKLVLARAAPFEKQLQAITNCMYQNLLSMNRDPDFVGSPCLHHEIGVILVSL